MLRNIKNAARVWWAGPEGLLESYGTWRGPTLWHVRAVTPGVAGWIPKTLKRAEALRDRRNTAICRQWIAAGRELSSTIRGWVTI